MVACCQLKLSDISNPAINFQVSMDSGALLRKVPFLSTARNDRVAGNPGKLLANTY